MIKDIAVGGLRKLEAVAERLGLCNFYFSDVVTRIDYTLITELKPFQIPTYLVLLYFERRDP